MFFPFGLLVYVCTMPPEDKVHQAVHDLTADLDYTFLTMHNVVPQLVGHPCHYLNPTTCHPWYQQSFSDFD